MSMAVLYFCFSGHCVGEWQPSENQCMLISKCMLMEQKVKMIPSVGQIYCHRYLSSMKENNLEGGVLLGLIHPRVDPFITQVWPKKSMEHWWRSIFCGKWECSCSLLNITWILPPKFLLSICTLPREGSKIDQENDSYYKNSNMIPHPINWGHWRK